MKSLLFFAFGSLVGTIAHAHTSKCHGVYENKGAEVRLDLAGGKYSLAGTTTAGEGFSDQVNCQGKQTGSRGDYDVYSANGDKDCPASFVKINPPMLVLARRQGGDTHDHSGYVYRYYRCE